jgi:hypothetical protein
MATASVARREPGRERKRKCRSNQGRFMSVQAAYRSGRLSDEGEEAYERICYELARLYKTR